MALNEVYKKRLEVNLEKLQKFADFEKGDKTVELVLNIARRVLTNPGDVQNIQWLLDNGAKLAAYYSYLEGKANETKAEAEIAEITYDNVYDSLLLSYKDDGGAVTYARSQAKQDLNDAAVDVQAKKQRAGYYATAGRAAEKIVSFIQSTLRNKESEHYQAKSAERGAERHNEQPQ